MAGDVSAFEPWYWREFFADTAELDAEQTGAYACLLGHLWLRGGKLPNDPDALCRLARVWDVERWPEIWEAIRGYLQVSAAHISQKRTTLELEAAKRRYKRRVEQTEKAREKLEQKRRSSSDTKTVTSGEPEPEPEPITTTTSCPDSGERDATAGSSESPERPLQDGSAIRVKPVKVVNAPSFDAQDVMHHIRRLALSLTPNQPEFSEKRWPKTLAAGALELDRLVRLDGATWPEVRSTVSWLIHEPPSASGFRWAAQVRSGAALRRHWSKIRVAMAQAANPGAPRRPSGPASFARGNPEPPDYQARQAERRELEQRQAAEAAHAVEPTPDIRAKIRAITGGKP